MLLFAQLADVHQAKGLMRVIALHGVVNGHRPVVALHRHQQIELLVAQIPLHRAAPGLFPRGDLQNVGEDVHRHRLSHLPGQLLLQRPLQIQKPAGIILHVASEAGQYALPLIPGLFQLGHAAVHLKAGVPERIQKRGAGLLGLGEQGVVRPENGPVTFGKGQHIPLKLRGTAGQRLQQLVPRKVQYGLRLSQQVPGAVPKLKRRGVQPLQPFSGFPVQLRLSVLQMQLFLKGVVGGAILQ